MLSYRKRILINTVATYSRTLVAIFLVLFSSRWVLLELGASDFGLFSLVGSLLVFISFLNTVLAGGDARFFSLMIGEKNKKGMRTLFKSSFVLHVLLSPILVLIGILVGELAVRFFLEIPEGRVDAALTILHISLVYVFFSMIAVPFRALFIAHQNITSSTFIELLQTVFLFFAAFFLRFYEGDKLVFYSLIYGSVQIIICLAFIVYASYKYAYCVKLRGIDADRSVIISFLKYAFWNALGDLGHLVRTQGVAIVVNLLFGTRGNAALGIANQVSMQASGLANSLLNATSPEIYRRIGAGETEAAVSLSEMFNKISVLLIVMLAVPVITNIDEILRLWLVNVPENAASLCVSFIVMYIMERYTTGFMVMLKAVNYISKVQIAVFVCYSLSVLFPFCGLCHYYGIMGIGISCVFSMLLSRVAVVWVYRTRFDFSLPVFLLRLVAGSLFVMAAVIFSAKHVIPQEELGISGILWISAVLLFATSLLFYAVVFDKKERTSLVNLIKRRF